MTATQSLHKDLEFLAKKAGFISSTALLSDMKISIPDNVQIMNNAYALIVVYKSVSLEDNAALKEIELAQENLYQIISTILRELEDKGLLIDGHLIFLLP
jgi:hypothetical protein